MKFRIGFFIVVLMMTYLHVSFALESEGRVCYGYFSDGLFDRSDSHIIERYEWTDTDTPNPRIVSAGYQDATIFGKIYANQDTIGRGTVGVFPEGLVSGTDFSMTLRERV